MTSTAEKVQAHLEASCKVFKRGTTWRTTSPLRGDSDSGSFAVKFNGGEYGAWTDHVTDEGGSLYDLAQRLGIETPERVPVEDTERKYESLADYAQAHGVSEDVFTGAGWSQGKHPGTERDAILIPTANGTRYRFIDNGGGSKYINQSGYKTCWYGLDRAVTMADERKLPLVLTNGEASTVVAQHYGIPAFAQTGGERKLPDDLLKALKAKWSGQVIIALDCDEKGRRVAMEIEEQLENAVSVDLGLSNKGDLADWCKLHTDESLKDLLALIPEKPVRKSSQTLSESRLALLIGRMMNPGAIRGLKTHMPSIDKALSGAVGGRTIVLYGDTGMGKSTLSASWAIKFAEQKPGLIFTTEIPGEAYIDKLACAIAHVPFNKLEDGIVTSTEFVRLEQAYQWLQSVRIEFEDGATSSASIPEITRHAIKEFGCGWVIVDSLSKIDGGSDETYNNMTNAANAVQNACTQTMIPFIATSQVGRNLKLRSNKVPTLHDAQGSGMIEQNADVVLALYNHQHYVNQGAAEPDERYPEGTTAIFCLKDRWRGNTGKAWRVTNVAGAAFYETSNESQIAV